MPLILRAAMAALLALGSTAFAQSPAPIPPIHYQSRTLANGLRVYSVRDPGSSNVWVRVWYNVGSRDDPRGRSGSAHLFDNMMFKASRTLVPEQFDRLPEMSAATTMP